VILLAGHYCHDRLLTPEGETRTLGGSTSYGAAILDAFGEPYEVAAKAGPDFLYADRLSRPPRIVSGRTTSFVDDYRGEERREWVEAVCEPLVPEDVPEGPFSVGLAFGVAGEVPLLVLARMKRVCGLVLADAQCLMREIDAAGHVVLRPVESEALRHLHWLKASRKEAALLDVAALRGRVSLIVTDGPRGCTLITAAGETRVPAEPAAEKDPTGAGDCFLAGFALGLARGLTPERAAALGAWCGARAVEHVGVPRLSADTIRAAPPA
jgi:1D-myo-inositol 3-kinase